MAGELNITLVGNLTADPELRFTTSGAAVVNFTVAQTGRRFDQGQQEWVDQDPVFMRCSGPWRDAAERVAESYRRGDRVIVVGTLRQRAYEDREGNKRTAYECDVHEIAASTRYAVVQVKRAARASEEERDQARHGATAEPAMAGAPS